MPICREIRCVRCGRTGTSILEEPFEDWSIFEDNHGRVTIDTSPDRWYWIGLCPRCQLQNDTARANGLIVEHIIRLEERSGIFPLTGASYIVPKRVYDAICVLLNPTKEGLSISMEK